MCDTFIEVDILEEPLKKHDVLDEGSLHVMHGLRHGIRRWATVDAMDYVMYRLGKKENGLQIFYQCLREAQYTRPSFREMVVKLERAGMIICITHNSYILYASSCILLQQKGVLILLPFLKQQCHIMYVIVLS